MTHDHHPRPPHDHHRRPGGLLAAAVLASAATSSAVAQASRDVPDERIATHLDGAFDTSDAIDSHRIVPTCEDGIVTLAGTVDHLLEKRRAVDLARATVGVRAVIDRIDVRRSDRADDAIRGDIRTALLADPATESYEVGVEVNRGVATLDGEVDSFAERRLAEQVAAGVRGVVAVRNRIDLDPTIDRSDDEILEDVRARLARTVTVDDKLLRVSVDDGEVTLAGVVGSAAEKWHAHDLAWIAGVDGVSVEDVGVRWWARDEMRRGDVHENRSDREVRSAVLDAFRTDPRIDADEPVVTVEDGMITLTGSVDDLRTKRAAGEVALDVIGAWNVDNHLRLEPETEVRDDVAEDRIAQALLRNAYVDRFNVTVRVINGHAHLYGTVDTAFERERAGAIAASVDGIVDVSNYLAISDAWDGPEDWVIRREIRDEFFWSPFVDGDDVTVTVVDGVATLAGTVDTMRERQIAAENAIEGGARSVDNELFVRNGPEPLRP